MMRDGNCSTFDVQVAHGHVVEAPRGLDLVLRVGELVLELEEVLAGLQVGVVLGNREQLAQRAGELVLGRAWASGPDAATALLRAA